MKEKKKALLRLIPITVLFLALTLGAWFRTPGEVSLSERRPLAQMPELSVKTALDGTFVKKFDTYTMDQFPFREPFRKFKSFLQYYVMGQKDVNDIFVVDGSAAKIEAPLNEKSVLDAAKKLQKIYDAYFKDTGSKAYLGMIPDKGFHIAAQNGYPALDYDRMLELLQENTGFAQWIDLTDTLEIGDYYNTDSHWRQEEIGAVADRIAGALGVEIAQDYEVKVARPDFSGVYAGQSALPLPAEPMYYLTSPVLEQAQLYNAETQKTTGLYDMDGLYGRDPYDLFLSGAAALQVITNPAAETDRELVIFRDSFSSSLTPLLVPGYSSITLVDLRYLSSNLLDQYLDFHGQDVLFLYAPGIYNSSNLLK